MHILAHAMRTHEKTTEQRPWLRVSSLVLWCSKHTVTLISEQIFCGLINLIVDNLKCLPVRAISL